MALMFANVMGMSSGTNFNVPLLIPICCVHLRKPDLLIGKGGSTIDAVKNP